MRRRSCAPCEERAAYLPDESRAIDQKEWVRHGGKWIVFDSWKEIEALAENLAPFIDDGAIPSAKSWNGDPSAINVYCLDRDRGKVREILKQAGARYVLVWEYDYAMGKNLLRPVTFAYSWFSKIRTILQSYGFAGSMKLLREALSQKRETESCVAIQVGRKSTQRELKVRTQSRNYSSAYSNVAGILELIINYHAISRNADWHYLFRDELLAIFQYVK